MKLVRAAAALWLSLLLFCSQLPVFAQSAGSGSDSFNFLVHNLSAGVYQVQLRIGVTTSATSNSLQAGATAMVGVGAGSLINLLVQAQTPFNNITLCGSAPNSGNAPNSCGPLTPNQLGSVNMAGRSFCPLFCVSRTPVRHHITVSLRVFVSLFVDLGELRT